ncbi:MAG: 2-oxoacid:acceptor oxidoreductase subunit alpha, partial [Halodesulfurarchaeum sp.]|nr:2-oxoacid:acceptor oxidoreductase subunit alpha [Halodesulfurarchaeum sp.]
NRKVETAKAEEEWDYREFGDPDANTLILSWGSNEGAICEGMDILAQEGIDVRFVSVPYLFPRPDLTPLVEDAETTIVVECNADGQFADVVEHDVLERVERINKYTGVRFKADEIAEEVAAIAEPSGGPEEEVEA